MVKCSEKSQSASVGFLNKSFNIQCRIDYIERKNVSIHTNEQSEMYLIAFQVVLFNLFFNYWWLLYSFMSLILKGP